MENATGVEMLTALTNDEYVDPYILESVVSTLARLDRVINYHRG
ncbi:hypothetical protein [Nostoc favosum]|nr:hypothetical protein [Nostoc favosum]